LKNNRGLIEKMIILKKSKVAEEQLTFALRQTEAGVTVGESAARRDRPSAHTIV